MNLPLALFSLDCHGHDWKKNCLKAIHLSPNCKEKYFYNPAIMAFNLLHSSDLRALNPAKLKTKSPVTQEFWRDFSKMAGCH